MTTFDMIFQWIATLEDVIKVKEVKFEIDLSGSYMAKLSKDEAELKKYHKLEKDYWKQKAGMRWFILGENNSRLFHSYVQKKMKKLHAAKT